MHTADSSHQIKTRSSRLRAPELRGRGWLNTGGRNLSLADLRGKILILDFWTFCCINCLHVLDELREIEAEFADYLVTIGVHSPKFEHEADPVALAAACERYEVHHPVLDDPHLETWNAYSARAWPTLVVIDPEGYIVATMAGEGHGSAVKALVTALVAEHEAKGTLRRGDSPFVPPPAREGALRFPAKVIALPSGNLLVADAGHHSLAELLPDGETLVRRIGSGERGLLDGGPSEARFSEPNGLCLLPDDVAAAVGYDVVVADTVNHALRGVRLADGWVTTLAGTGEQYLVGGVENVTNPDGTKRAYRFGVTGAVTDANDGADRGTPPPPESTPALCTRLSSPWDVVWSDGAHGLLVAMAGTHTIWLFDPLSEQVRLVAGTMAEGLRDGLGTDAWFAQPSGLAARTVAPGESFWVADSETSALRVLELADEAITVHTAVGKGLFDFGHRDGKLADALFQHPLGVVALPDGSAVVADTYNGAIRRVRIAAGGEAGTRDEGDGEVTTLATGLAEPSGVLVETGPDGGLTLLVVESAAHRLTRIALPADLAGEVRDGVAKRTQRPATVIAPGPLQLQVPFAPASGQKLDDRWGPSTSLQVSATPPELLLEGAGSGSDLERSLVINPEVASGVLHVTAKAASCDAVGEFPACHLAQQDWGVPVVVLRPAGGSDFLSLTEADKSPSDSAGVVEARPAGVNGERLLTLPLRG